MYFNDVSVIQLSKKMRDQKSIKISSGFNTYSPKNMFNLTSVNVRDVQLDVKRLLLPKNLNVKELLKYKMEESSLLFRIAKGNLNIKFSNEFSLEMENVTKKKPPNKTSIQMIINEFNENNLSTEDHNKSIFKNLISYPAQGKIYIGFTTNQTTGCCCHIAARVIPTVSIFFIRLYLIKINNIV